MLPVDPEMWFCVAHGDAVFDLMYELFDGRGLIDHDIVMGPGDEFDELVEQLRQGR
jgi:hypothetical protein